jgi:2,4-dichlorophenol 6-monooxygenase
VWLYDAQGVKHSTLDLTKGGFALLTGLNGRAWADAAAAVAARMGIALNAYVIGPRQPLIDHTGDWARAREVGEGGCVLVRPDHHVAWRSEGLADDPQAELARVLTTILAKGATT